MNESVTETQSTGHTWPVLPADPGFYILEHCKEEGGGVYAVKVSIIGWRMLPDGVLPITAQAIHQPDDEPYAILCPDGHVEYNDGGIGSDVENFLDVYRTGN